MFRGFEVSGLRGFEASRFRGFEEKLQTPPLPLPVRAGFRGEWLRRYEREMSRILAKRKVFWPKTGCVLGQNEKWVCVFRLLNHELFAVLDVDTLLKVVHTLAGHVVNGCIGSVDNLCGGDAGGI